VRAKTKKEFFIDLLLRPERTPERTVAEGVRVRDGLTLGTDYRCDVTIGHLELPTSYSFLEKRGRRSYTLKLPKFARGVLRKGRKALPIHTLIEMDLLKKSGKFYLVEVKPGNSGEVQVGNTSLIFGYRDKPPLPPKPHFIPLISGKEYVFLLAIIISTAMHVTLVSYLNTLEIKKPTSIEALKKMEPRFARLILTPREIRKEKKSTLKVKKEKKKEKAKEEPKKEKPPEKPKVAKKTKAGRKGKIAAKVKKKGLLGVIGAKGGILSDLNTDDVLRNVDSIIKSAKRGGGSGDDLVGLGVMELAGLPEGLEDPDAGLHKRSEDEIIKEKKEIATFGTEEEKVEEDIPKRAEAEVYRVVRSYVGGLKYLYNKALRKNSTLRGTITVRLVIADDGNVKNVEMVDSTIDHPPLEESILRRIGLWKFDKREGWADFTIVYSFDFAPVG
jgi:hypothetical protein